MARGIAPALLGVLLALPVPVLAHVVLDPDLVHRMVVEIAQYQRQSRDESNPDAEALYRVGEKAQELVDLLNQDVSSHGKADLLAQLVVKRLETYQVKVTFSEREARFAYDLTAFREYLERAPKGKRAAEARFRLITRAFYDTVDADPSTLVNTDVSGLAVAVAQEERFLRDYPRDARTREVRFFLGVDYYRLSKNVGAPDRATQYRRLSRQVLEAVLSEYPGTVEARAAEALLEKLRP